MHVGILNWLLGRTEGGQKKHEDLCAAGITGADLLTALCDKFCPSFFDALIGDNPSAATNEVTARGSAEVLAFALHLTDRIAFARLGNENRAVFMDALLLAVQRKVHAPLKSVLLGLYNQRTLFYQACRMPSGEKMRT
jgi:hypothetical protein